MDKQNAKDVIVSAALMTPAIWLGSKSPVLPSVVAAAAAAVTLRAAAGIRARAEEEARKLVAERQGADSATCSGCGLSGLRRLVAGPL